MQPDGKLPGRKDRLMITVKQSGNFKHTEGFFKKVKELRFEYILDKYGREGVAALSSATPKRTGKTASSWSYTISSSEGGYRIDWTNSNVNKGVNIALILQTGHGTRNGGYVTGVDYINPALEPIFNKLAEEAWGEVTKA